MSNKEYLDWVYTFLEASPEERKNMRQCLLEGLKYYEKGRRYNRKSEIRETEKGRELYKFFNSKNVTLIGFCPRIEYILEKSTDDDKCKAIFEHKFGGSSLLFASNDSPVLFLTAPSLRFNDSHIMDSLDNEFPYEILGITD